MASQLVDIALHHFAEAKNDTERLAALFLLTKAAPPKDIEERAYMRERLGLRFAARLLRAPQLTFRAMGAGVLALLHAAEDEAKVLTHPQLLAVLPELVTAALAAAKELPEALGSPPQAKADGHEDEGLNAVEEDMAAEELPEALGDPPQACADGHEGKGVKAVGEDMAAPCGSSTRKGDASATDAHAAEASGGQAGHEAGGLLEDALQLLSVVATVAEGRATLLRCGLAEALPELLRAVPSSKGAMQGLHVAVQLVHAHGEQPRAPASAVSAALAAVAATLRRRRDTAKMEACEALTALLRAVASQYPVESAARRQAAQAKPWQRDASAALLALLQHKLGPELRGPVFAAVAACFGVAGAGWCCSSDLKETTVAGGNSSQRAGNSGEDYGTSDAAGAERGGLASLQLVARLAAVELRMQLEEPDPTHAVAAGQLVFDCLSIMEGTLRHLVDGGEILAKDEAWEDIYGALKASVSASLLLLESVNEAAWTFESLDSEQRHLLAGVSRLLGAWSAEETDALQLELAVGCATLCRVLNDPESVGILMPGLYNLSFDEAARNHLVQQVEVLNATGAVIAATSEGHMPLPGSSAANFLLHLTLQAPKKLLTSPAFVSLHDTAAKIVGLRQVARRHPEMHTYLCLAFCKWLLHDDQVLAVPDEIARALGGAGLVLSIADQAEEEGWLEAALSCLDQAVALSENVPEAQQQLARASTQLVSGEGQVEARAGPEAFLAALQARLHAGPHGSHPEVVARVAETAQKLGSQVEVMMEVLSL